VRKKETGLKQLSLEIPLFHQAGQESAPLPIHFSDRLFPVLRRIKSKEKKKLAA